MVYFDNAATSWPKPEKVINAISDFNRNIGANPGRSGHRMSVDAGRIAYDTREKVATIFGVHDALSIVFTKNATEAANIATIGLLKKGDSVLTTGIEHNAIMRPLRYLEKSGIEIIQVPSDRNGYTDPSDIEKSIKSQTKAVYVNHVSNVTGTISDIASIGGIARQNGLIMCVDAAQSAGILPIDVETMNIDLLLFTGHKGLMGPQGTGGIYIRKGLESLINPIVFGGTGSRSEFEEQPDFMPDKYEGGTLNTPGLAGLAAGIDFINEMGIDKIIEHEVILSKMLIDGLTNIDGVEIYGRKVNTGRTGVVSFKIADRSVSEVAMILDEKYSIMTRPGLHCSPATHKSIGTFPEGTIRASIGIYNTKEHIERMIQAVGEIAQHAKSIF